MQKPSRPGGQQPGQEKTPASDMQQEDAGTAESGNADSSGQVESTPSEKSMKQTSKTDAERKGGC